MILETERLRIIAGTVASTHAAAVGDHQALEKELSASVPDSWPPQILSDAQEFMANYLKQNPQENLWWMWYVILKSKKDILIGSVGLKGPPNKIGEVEVGYSILDEYQRKGYATEAMLALIHWTKQQPNVIKITAQTFPHISSSIRVMEKCGMSYLGEGSELGTIKYGFSVE